MSDMNVGVSHVMYHQFFGKGMIVMSDIAYDWIALGVAAILFVILAFLKRKKNAVSPHACCLQRHSVSFWESLSTATLIMSARVGSIWSNAIPHWWFRCCCSASSPHHEPWRVHALKEYWCENRILPAALTLTKLNPIHFFKAFFPAGVVAFTSESSIGTVPVTVRQLRSAGVPGDIARSLPERSPHRGQISRMTPNPIQPTSPTNRAVVALNFAPNAMFSASGDDACCGTKPNK